MPHIRRISLPGLTRASLLGGQRKVLPFLENRLHRVGVPHAPKEGARSIGSWIRAQSSALLDRPSAEGDPIDLPDPGLRDKEKPSGYRIERFSGPLFVDGVSDEDVRQGKIADCYFVSCLAAIAYTDPGHMDRMVTDNKNGTYTVHFYDAETFEPVNITIDADFWVTSSGAPVYASALDHRADKDRMELWAALIEKAYATWKGSYETIGHGGMKTTVFEELYGVPSQWAKIKKKTPDEIFATLKAAQENGFPCVASTYGKDDPEAARYPGTRLSAWHVYSVRGVKEEGGQRYVQLRNPWGDTEPGSDEKDDGIFWMKLEDFMSYYKELAWAPTHTGTGDIA